MISSILSALFAVLLSVEISTAQADTVDHYFINGLAVERFDGSQLLGKTISQYSIAVEDKGSQVVRSHYIAYDCPVREDEISVVGTGTFNAEEPAGGLIIVKKDASVSVVFVVDGKVTTEAAFKALDVNNISSMEIIKHKEDPRYLEYIGDGNEGKDGVILVTTKKGERKSASR